MSDVLVLNVGGVTHVTSRTTLSNARHSMLWARFKPQQVMQSSTFIDRNGHLFYIVLEYLRTQRIPAQVQDVGVLQDVLREAMFYGLDGMCDAIRRRVEALRKPSHVYFVSATTLPRLQAKVHALALRKHVVFEQLQICEHGEDYVAVLRDSKKFKPQVLG